MLDHISNRLTFDLSALLQTQTDEERGEGEHGDEHRVDKQREGRKAEMAKVQNPNRKA